MLVKLNACFFSKKTKTNEQILVAAEKGEREYIAYHHCISYHTFIAVADSEWRWIQFQARIYEAQHKFKWGGLFCGLFLMLLV